MTVADKISAISAAVATATFVAGVATLIKAILEYRRQNSTKRFEIFQGMNARFDESKFMEVRELLDDDSPNLAAFDYTTKHNFLGFFEEISISVNSRVMNAEVAFYMFGYYAIRCWESDNFWLGDKMLVKNSPYWRLFAHFVEQMKSMESKLVARTIDPRKLKF